MSSCWIRGSNRICWAVTIVATNSNARAISMILECNARNVLIRIFSAYLLTCIEPSMCNNLSFELNLARDCGRVSWLAGYNRIKEDRWKNLIVTVEWMRMEKSCYVESNIFNCKCIHTERGRWRETTSECQWRQHVCA